MTNPETITTRLHAYRFNLNDAEEAAEYDSLCRALRNKVGIKGDKFAAKYDHLRTVGRGSPMHANATPVTGPFKVTAGPVTLETAHLFGNQWNTQGEGDAKGFRVFDWYEGITYGSGGRRTPSREGHYLEITPEMIDLRCRTLQCGYCGKQTTANGYRHAPEFCDQCLGSDHLQPTDLHLLKLLPIAESFGGERAELTKEQTDEMMPLYAAAQVHGHGVRSKAYATKKRAEIIARCDKETADAVTERDGFLWLMDHGLSVENVIYYNHTARFCFGWREPLSAEVCSELLDHISEFPYPYEIKRADGEKTMTSS